ncbi:hypothetical protein M5689_010700 [Euphorbia peplus]|nr:hypothetical protein M5689_010700 [Euphorbia peplus]
MTSDTLTLRFHHGGTIVNEGIGLKYVGGYIHNEVVKEDKLSRIELLWVLNGLGYENCGSIFYNNGINGRLFLVLNDRNVITMVNCKGENEIVEIFVDKTDDAKTSGAQNDARVDIVANMVIDTISNTDEEDNEGYQCVETNLADLQVDLQADLQDDHGENDDDADLSLDSSSDEGPVSGKDSDEDVDDVDINIDDSDASEFDEDLARVRESIARNIKRDRSNKKRAKAPIEVQLGPLGTDKVYDPTAYRHKRDKEDFITGDEDYIGSSDVDSFDSNEDDDDGPKRRRRTRVHYVPQWEEPVLETGMIFKNVQEFRDAVGFYAVKRGAKVNCDPNDSERVRARCNGKQGCPWELFASINKKDKKLQSEYILSNHTCSKTNKNRHCNSKFISMFFKEKVTETPETKI